MMTAPLLIAFTALLGTMTLAPFVPIAHGIVRVCDFPRLQIIGAAAVLFGLTIALLPISALSVTLLAVQGSIAAMQSAVCLRFTPLWRVQSIRSDRSSDHPSALRVFTANVKMSNRNYSKVIRLVRERDPHIAAFMETDRQWISNLSPLKDRLPYVVERPQDNGYGLLLLSRLPLMHTDLRFLVMEEVPSIKATVKLTDGRLISLYIVHPEPPVPFEDTLGRDDLPLSISSTEI